MMGVLLGDVGVLSDGRSDGNGFWFWGLDGLEKGKGWVDGELGKEIVDVDTSRENGLYVERLLQRLLWSGPLGF